MISIEVTPIDKFNVFKNKVLGLSIGSGCRPSDEVVAT